MPKKNWKRLEIDIYTKIVEIPAPTAPVPRRRQESRRPPKPVSVSDTDNNWRRGNSLQTETPISKAEIKSSNSEMEKHISKAEIKPSKADTDMNWRKK